jgi:predicted ArsR family transcriptional regulator
MAKSGEPHIVGSKTQIAALSSAVRQDIADALAQAGPTSVAALAAMLGRPADALYYHLKILQKAGLVEAATHRTADGRREALFQAVAADFRIDSEAVRREGGEALVAVVNSMLRLGARDYARALQDETVALSGAGRELSARRKTVWMTPEQVARFNETVERLTAEVAGPPGQGRLYAVTVLLTPLDHQRRAGPASAGDEETA